MYSWCVDADVYDHIELLSGTSFCYVTNYDTCGRIHCFTDQAHIGLTVKSLTASRYRKTCNTSPRLYIGTCDLDPSACIGDPWLLMETRLVLKHCQLAILNFLCVYGILDFKYETTNTFTFYFVETVRLLGLLLPQLAPGGHPACIGDPACIWDWVCIRSFTVS